MKLILLPVFALLSGCADVVQRLDTNDLEVLTIRRGYNNVHLIESEGALVLVDAGLERHAPRIDDALRRAGADPSELDLVVVTHGHADHAGGAAWFRNEYGTPILAGSGDQGLLDRGANDTLCPTDATAKSRLASAQAETYTPFVPDFVVSPGEERSLADLDLPGVVVGLPGHTEGSVIYRVGDAVAVGDLIRGSITGSAARTHFFMCDESGNREDVERLLDEIAPTADDFLVGHFGPLDRADIQTWLDEG